MWWSGWCANSIAESVDDNAGNLIGIIKEKIVAHATVDNTQATVGRVADPRVAATVQVSVNGLNLGLCHGADPVGVLTVYQHHVAGWLSIAIALAKAIDLRYRAPILSCKIGPGQALQHKTLQIVGLDADCQSGR